MIDRGTFLGLASALAAFPHVARHDDRLPLTIGMNRAFVRATVAAGKDRVQPALAWLDTGGGKVVLRRDVARLLRLKTVDGPVTEDGQRFLPLEPFTVTFGSTTVRVESRDALMLDADGFMPGVPVDMLFPMRLLRDHAVTFDYPGKSFTIDAQEFSGAVPLATSNAGYARIPVRIANEEFQMLLDTGASCTMLSRAVIDRLRAAHPRWRSVPGAYGDANMLGTALETNAESLLVPRMLVAGTELRDVMVVSRPEGTFEKWMSQLTDAPVVGSLGGNALRNFALTIDYPNARAKFAYAGWDAGTHGPMVPLILEPQPDERYVITGVLDRPAYAPVRSRLLGAELVAVDGSPVRHSWMWQVHAMLRGTAGTSKRLSLARNGATDMVDVLPTDVWA